MPTMFTESEGPSCYAWTTTSQNEARKKWDTRAAFGSTRTCHGLGHAHEASLGLATHTLAQPYPINSQSAATKECNRALPSKDVNLKAWLHLPYHASFGSLHVIGVFMYVRRCTTHGIVEHDASCTRTMSTECEGSWGHAHAGRVQGPLGACPCRPRARDAGGPVHAGASVRAAGRMPMPTECERRWGHAHDGRVRGPLGAYPCRPSAVDGEGHVHAGRVRGPLGACPCRSTRHDAVMSTTGRG
ncbi:hypothetical protein HAX54_039435 [Datura stramonium]|uniref:Uncharacterized protein n=1 Tax=Datura stramonium TaxID=4076 RepID=A0ABS8VML0_DATST|nr:hypothetical protein [Datura stramonium]